ncbi:MAG: hypothetical protein JKY56_16395 [Kofleriaceae bacterium]|nr:hypothetical protein [Kofleriaceae bacterium]
MTGANCGLHLALSGKENSHRSYYGGFALDHLAVMIGHASEIAIALSAATLGRESLGVELSEFFSPLQQSVNDKKKINIVWIGIDT